MTLTFEIKGPQAAQLGASARKVFAAAGGSIGRTPDNDWVIPDPYISSHHARVHYRDGRYFLEDTSTNGVFVSNPNNRLAKGDLYPLETGERVFIDAYEIHVMVKAVANQDARAASVLGDLFGGAAATPPAAGFIPEDPFGSAPPPASISATDQFARPAFAESQSLAASADPLELLGLGAKPVSAPVPTAADLARHSPLNDHFVPPTAPVTAPPASTASDALIPDDYDFLSDGLAVSPPSPLPTPTPPKAIVRPTPGAGRVSNAASSITPPLPPPTAKPTTVPPPAVQPPRNTPPRPVAPPLPQQPATSGDTGKVATISDAAGSLDLQTLLASAGVPATAITPELAENLGAILRVVVDGVMDVLRARERIKDEFRMRMTTFKPADNNPLKFSANVDDALYNLLVKRNAAYLGPVAAFEDGFQDIRNHQVAMLAGMRVAYDTLLKSFDPEQLQERFDKHGKRGGLLAGPAKMRYWDQYRERFHDMVKDPESSFRELFGAEFARAYEEQMERLRVINRNTKKTP
jgi:type VI secretion system FHA domain protein